jgi:cyclopropane-fatty-acyl-phospholipid synthase
LTLGFLRLHPNPANMTATAPTVLPTQAPPHRALKLLRNLKGGPLTVLGPDGTQHVFGDAGPVGSAPITLTLYNWNLFAAALRSGDIGVAETFMAGDWETSDLTALLSLFIDNRKQLDAVIYGSWLGRLAYRVQHLFKRNTRRNSKKNIHAHYDLGNAFYDLWLDESKNYSSAWFGAAGQGSGTDKRDQSFTDAQYAKVRRALRQVKAKTGDRILEIGCGWGALAEMAAVEFKAELVGVTLSTEQLDAAQERMRRVGAKGVSLRLQDYRDITDGPFDAVCSIEMIEAVGQEYWATYFDAIHRLLKPGGLACVQSIVIDDSLFDRYITSTDFIQQYVFPGGCLPCPREFKRQAAKAGLTVVDEMAFGLDYAETLRRWRVTFVAQREAVLALGFDDRFTKLWTFYLAYCEAAFLQANVDVVQFTLQKSP